METAIEKNWEVYALKYAERADRTRSDSFIFDDHSHQAHTIDYFIWVLKSEKDIIKLFKKSEIIFNRSIKHYSIAQNWEILSKKKN